MSLGDIKKEGGTSLNGIEDKAKSPQDNDDLNIIISLFGFYTLRIYKPLIPLKIVLFIFYGGASYLYPFMPVYFKQQGITLAEMSAFLAISPIVQVLGSVIAGVIADKIGKSKPILAVCLLLALVFLIGILLVPRLNGPDCTTTPINLKCHPEHFDRLITTTTSCDIVQDVIEINSCNVQCPNNVTNLCDEQNLICKMRAGIMKKRNISLFISVRGFYKNKDRCYYNISSVLLENKTVSWCSDPQKMDCKVSCKIHSGIKCNPGKRRFYLIATMVLYILWSTASSNCFRFLDLTSMLLAKTHGSNFGHERFFSISGGLFLSPLAGLIANVTTVTGGERNLLSAFYFYIAIITLMLFIIIFYLDVQTKLPGRNMVKKSIYLFKKPDVLSFAIVIFTLGTAFNFSLGYGYWYLAELKASSLLLGLLPALSAVYGLPFLATSAWWVRKLGARQILVLGFLAYLVRFMGYSFLYNPWYSLILEASCILTYHLLWVAAVEHSHELAPEGLTATVIASFGSIHYQLAKSSAALVGGPIMNTFGGRAAFRVFGIACLICAVLYGCYLYIRKCWKSNHNPKD